ncbi:MAG: (Fe-S)-binding protein [Candidatus Hydrothermarchaeota archaeon]
MLDCTTCRLCAVKCPTEINLDEIIKRYRYLNEIRTPHGGVFHILGKILIRVDISDWLKEDELDIGRDDLYYFPGCLPIFDLVLDRDRSYSGIAHAGIKVLNKLGISPKIIYGCCGHDLLYSGNLDEFEINRINLKGKVEGKKIITGCAECYHILKNEYQADVEHFSQFISKNLNKLDLSNIDTEKLKTTYHDPCRLGRYNSIYNEPRELLEKITSFSEMSRNREETICCGVSSWLNCDNLSRELREEKIKEAIETGSDSLVTSCPKCIVHLDCLYEEKLGDLDLKRLNIVDLQEILAHSLGIYDLQSDEKFYEIKKRKSTPIKSVEIKKDPLRYIDRDLSNLAYRCTTCYACETACPMEYKPVHMMEDFRKFLVSQNLNPERHNEIYNNILETGNVFGEKEEIFDEKVDHDVVYFPGCVASFRARKIVDSCRELMDRIGVNYTIPKGTICCGSIAFRTGFNTRPIVEKNMQVLNGKKIVCSCSGCYATFKKDYGLNAIHFIDLLLDNKNKLKFKKSGVKIAYHDPCHLGREFQYFDPPRELLKLIPELELVEFPHSRENSLCCGGGGGVRSAFPELSAMIAKKRMEEIENESVDAVVTACPFCEINLGTVTDKKVYDISQFLLIHLK